MKPQLFVLIVVAMIVALAGSVAASSFSGTALDASLLTYSPVPAQPGDSVDVWIQVINNASVASKAGTLTILDSSPFTVESDKNRVREFPSIPSLGTFLVKTQVRVDKNANVGDNFLNIRVQEQGSTSSVDRSVPISVQGRSSVLSIVSATTTPSEIAPGGSATLAVRVKNAGDTQLRNVVVSLGLGGLSIAPTSTGTSQTIPSLRGGEERTIQFTLTAYPDAAVKAYQLPLNLSYQDEQGTAHAQQETIGIVINAKPELLVYFDRTDVSKETGQGNVIIKFVNKGLSQIKLLEVQVVETPDVTVLSDSSSVYVGNIDVDDYQSADITLKVGKDTAQVPLKVTYKDALNQDHSEEITLTVQRKSQNGTNGGWSWIIWALVLVVAVGGFWIWRRRRRSAARRQAK
jgi:hypothetical protein